MSSFREIIDGSNKMKMKAYFGYRKKICITKFKGKSYIHISDTKKCNSSGLFDHTLAEKVSLSMPEALNLRDLLISLEACEMKISEQVQYIYSLFTILSFFTISSDFIIMIDIS